MALSKIGIILINYKDYADRFLADCRDSLRSQTYPHDYFKVYIVDNLTSDETLSRLRILYPEAVVLSTSGNGWGHANNVGMTRAFEDGCSAVVLANMDTIFDKCWLEELVSVGQLENIGIVQSKVMLYPSREGKFFLNSIGNSFHYLGFGFATGYNLPAESYTNNDVVDIGYASGVAMYIQKDIALKINMCDEFYFMYHDDLELSLKVKLIGLRVVLAPRSIVHHKYEFGRSIIQLYYMERNRYITLFTFLKFPTLLLIAPALFIMECGMWIFAILRKWVPIKWNVTKFFCKLSTWIYIFETRKRLLKFRVISDKQLLHNVVGKIEFQEIDNLLLRYIGNPFLNSYWKIAKKLILW